MIGDSLRSGPGSQPGKMDYLCGKYIARDSAKSFVLVLDMQGKVIARVEGDLHEVK